MSRFRAMLAHSCADVCIFHDSGVSVLLIVHFLLCKTRKKDKIQTTVFIIIVFSVEVLFVFRGLEVKTGLDEINCI